MKAIIAAFGRNELVSSWNFPSLLQNSRSCSPTYLAEMKHMKALKSVEAEINSIVTERRVFEASAKTVSS